MQELIEVTREFKFFVPNPAGPLFPPTRINLFPKQINRVDSELWDRFLAHKNGRNAQLVEGYAQKGELRWLSDDGKEAQAKVDGQLPFLSAVVPPAQAAAVAQAQVLDSKGVNAKNEAEELAEMAAARALELGGSIDRSRLETTLDTETGQERPGRPRGA